MHKLKRSRVGNINDNFVFHIEKELMEGGAERARAREYWYPGYTAALPLIELKIAEITLCSRPKALSRSYAEITGFDY